MLQSSGKGHNLLIRTQGVIIPNGDPSPPAPESGRGVWTWIIPKETSLSSSSQVIFPHNEVKREVPEPRIQVCINVCTGAQLSPVALITPWFWQLRQARRNPSVRNSYVKENPDAGQVSRALYHQPSPGPQESKTPDPHTHLAPVICPVP